MPDNFTFILLVILVALAAPGGMILGYYARKLVAAREKDTAEVKIKNMIDAAKAKERDILLKAKEKAYRIIENAEKEEAQRRRELGYLQRRLEKREALFDQKLLAFEDKQQKLQEKITKVEQIKQEIEDLKNQELKKLEKIAHFSKEEAKRELIKIVENEIKEDLSARIRKIQNEAQEEFEEKARNVLASVIQRVATDHTSETTTTILPIPSEEMKGRIIGKEGRNIKTLEHLTGVEIIIDETPDSIMISGFSPLRRQVAYRALEMLMADGRIHPARIEETVEKAKRELIQIIKEAGEEAAYKAGVAGLHPKLLQILGRLKYRTSYGQNVLKHSIEVAHLASLLAAELGANVSVCKKGGLLHDIGKAVDHEIQGPHTEIGYDIMKKFGLPEEVAYIAIAHHEDQPKTLEGLIVKIADAISGSRPGARKETFEQYIQRLEELEEIATSFEGVEKAYAIQAGREIRVFVSPKRIDDWGAQKLAKEIAKKIEQELEYPGEIKVNVIRETRITEYAR